MSKHITAVVAVSASGRMTPPFFIIDGKQAYKKWFSPVVDKVHSMSKDIERFIKQRSVDGGSNWFGKRLLR